MWCVADENMETRKKNRAVWAVCSIEGRFYTVCSIDGSIYTV